MKYDNIIAIDPDVEKSGVASLKPKTRDLKVSNLAFPELLAYLSREKEYASTKGLTLIVLVEAGWMAKGNWHLSQRETKHRAASKGYDVGRNHETGMKIVECAKYMGVETLEHFPLRKCWKGKDGKITHEELAYFTGLTGRTNQDARDAALLAWSFANLPIKMNCK